MGERRGEDRGEKDREEKGDGEDRDRGEGENGGEGSRGRAEVGSEGQRKEAGRRKARVDLQEQVGRREHRVWYEKGGRVDQRDQWKRAVERSQGDLYDVPDDEGQGGKKGVRLQRAVGRTG